MGDRLASGEWEEPGAVARAGARIRGRVVVAGWTALTHPRGVRSAGDLCDAHNGLTTGLSKQNSAACGLALMLWNDLDSVGDVLAEYRCHGKASLMGSGLSPLLIAKGRTPLMPPVAEQ
jgi:hypothetical protein